MDNIGGKLVIPMDENYIIIVGQIVYSFGYYEWMIIYIMQLLESGFVYKYSRELSLTSGNICKRFKEIINKVDFPINNISKVELENCQIQFESLVTKRNALIHAHPITDISNNYSQILYYQTKISKPYSDLKWTISELNLFLMEINDAVIATGKIHDKAVHNKYD